MKKLFNMFIYFLGFFTLLGIIGPALGKNAKTLGTLLFWFLCLVGAKALIDKHRNK